MQEEVNINTIHWTALEYDHKEHSADWYWTIGIITLVGFVIAVWTKSYLFAIFIALSGASLSLFHIRHPKEIEYLIETESLTMGKDKYEWNKIKGFDIKKRDGQNKLLIELDKYFLPVYTIVIPNELTSEIREALLQVTERLELEESQSMLFVEKLGL